MKKILDIIKLQQANQSYQLQLDFRTQRRNLKRYLKSLKQLKPRIKDNHSCIANLNQRTTEIANQQGNIKKKFSQLDYYMLNGVKIFKALSSQSKKLQGFYQNLHTKAKELIDRVEKYLDQSKQSFNRVAKQHEKIVKQYTQKCFPETTTILFKIGFTSADKIKKTDDMLKQQALIRQSQLYMNVLNNYLDQMQGLRKQCIQLFKEYYMASTNLWIQSCESLRIQMSQYTINQSQIQQYYQETGGAMTDRSDRSTKMNNTYGQEQI